MNYSNQYISKELFHFIGRHEKTEIEQFDVLRTILQTEVLKSSKMELLPQGTKWGSNLHTSQYSTDGITYEKIIPKGIRLR